MTDCYVYAGLWTINDEVLVLCLTILFGQQLKAGWREMPYTTSVMKKLNGIGALDDIKVLN